MSLTVALRLCEQAEGFIPSCPFAPSQAMEGSMLTLSLANWMELPGLKLKDWMRDKRRFVLHETT